MPDWPTIYVEHVAPLLEPAASRRDWFGWGVTLALGAGAVAWLAPRPYDLVGGLVLLVAGLGSLGRRRKEDPAVGRPLYRRGVVRALPADPTERAVELEMREFAALSPTGAGPPLPQPRHLVRLTTSQSIHAGLRVGEEAVLVSLPGDVMVAHLLVREDGSVLA